MTSTPLLTAYALLARNQYRAQLRRMQHGQGAFMRIVLGVMMAYSAFILLTLGFFFDRFSSELWPGIGPVEVVNRYLLAAFVSMFFIRFLFQKTPQMKIVPYMHLPIGRWTLISFFQGSSLFSIHNFFPLLFFVPFWMRFVDFNSMWLIAVLFLIVSSHFANILLRSILQRKASLFFLLMTAFMVAAFVDETAGTAIQQRASVYLFSLILTGDILIPGLLFLVSAAVTGAASLSLMRSAFDSGAHAQRARATTFEIPASWGLTGQLVRLEILLMWRNRRPRHYLFVSLLFSTMYLVFMLGARNAFDGVAFAALLGLFASGGFVLNYGQLMFGWDSSFYPALVSRNVAFRKLVKAKLIVLQASCLILFIASVPLFMWFRPELIGLHFSFLFYNAGITSILILELAVRNKQAVDIGKSGGFFNYQGFSARHWIWFIPTALPPVIFLVVMNGSPRLALILLASIGLISLLLTEAWTRYFARGLRRRKHQMLEGFRNSAR